MRFGFDNRSFYRGLFVGLVAGVLTQLLSYVFVQQQWGRPDSVFSLILHAVVYGVLGWWACAKVRTVEEGYVVGGSFGIGMALGFWVPAVVAIFVLSPGYLTLRTAGLLLPAALFSEVKFALIPLMMGRWRGMRQDHPSNTLDRQ